MNQILITKKSKIVKKKTYLIQFFIFTFIIVFLFINLSLEKYYKKNEKDVSYVALNSHSLFKLYQDKTPKQLSVGNQLVSIIGTIEIPKINISYPIFSKCSEELLKISICKFYGPNLNEVGNLCIAGHNYDNESFFSNVFLLELDDKIYIYDNNSKVYIYSIYEIFEINPTDLSCISQNTNRK